MARAVIVVEVWIPGLGWQYDKGFPGAAILAALAHAKDLESKHFSARVYRCTPDGPKDVYESPRS